jgi:hypothetical protein
MLGSGKQEKVSQIHGTHIILEEKGTIKIFFFFFCGKEFELRAFTLSHSTSPFSWVFLR